MTLHGKGSLGHICHLDKEQKLGQTHLTTRRRQTGGVTFSCSRDPRDTEAHVGLSPPLPDLGILGDSWKHAEVATEMHGTEQQQTSQAAEHMLCIAMGSWGG